MNNYISVKLILDRIMQHPLLTDLTLETAITYTVDFMRIVGVNGMFLKKCIPLYIEDYRVVLPEDFYKIDQVKYGDTICKVSSDNFFNTDPTKDVLNTYKIQGNILYSSIKEGNIIISYYSIPTDEEGFPMILDNSSYLRALELYIKKQWFTILFDLGKILGSVLLNVQQEYAWAVGDCESEFHRMSLDLAELFYKSMKYAIGNDKHYDYGFKHLGG